MHWLDRAARFSAARLPPGKRPFNLGWGDEDVVRWYLDQARVVPAVADIAVRTRPARRSGSLVVRDLEFDSPFEMLPARVRPVRARWLSTHPEPDRVVVLHAAWNDEDYRTRSRLGRELVARGIAAIMLQHPFYGDRRRDPNLAAPVPTVADFCLMGRGGVLEGRSLVTYLHRAGYRVGVSGYSMGGNIAAFVGTLLDIPVAISATASPYAAGPALMGGLLRETIAWEALGGDTPEVAGRLSAVLHAGSLLDHTPAPHTAAAVLVAGSRDGFVPTSSTQAIHRHWPGSKMVWVSAGHASLLFANRDVMAAAVVESFERLEALQT